MGRTSTLAPASCRRLTTQLRLTFALPGVTLLALSNRACCDAQSLLRSQVRRAYQAPSSTKAESQIVKRSCCCLLLPLVEEEGRREGREGSWVGLHDREPPLDVLWGKAGGEEEQSGKGTLAMGMITTAP